MFEFTLRDAIERGFLCKYYYYPIICRLNDLEMDEYVGLSKTIATLYSTNVDPDDKPPDMLKNLLIKRARLISRLESKIDNLKIEMKKNSDSSYILIYCGDSKDGDIRQVDTVTRLLGTEIGIRCQTFTAEESAPERAKLLSQFEAEELQALVAIRCLDEGVDVPRTETAYILASSTNPRQYIQRRGRVLRLAEGKKSAKIYDFIAVADQSKLGDTGSDVRKIERRLVKKELKRVDEFAKMAINYGDALRALREIKVKLGLLDA